MTNWCMSFRLSLVGFIVGVPPYRKNLAVLYRMICLVCFQLASCHILCLPGVLGMFVAGTVRPLVVVWPALSFEAGAAAKAKPLAKKKPAPKLKGAVFRSEDINAYLPKMIGCYTSIETVWHHRVRIFYPTAAPPGYKESTFEKAGSQRQAVLMCVRWAWAQHTEATGAICPYDLPDPFVA
jgi:hypothetical protein